MALSSINNGALERAWKTHKLDFSVGDREIFEKYACFGIDEYMDKLEVACKSHNDAHVRHKIYTWFEPIFNSVKLLVPTAESTLKATPVPGAGAAVLGGVVCLISVAERLFEYQKRSMQMLEDIGASLNTLLLYEKVLYENDLLISQALEIIYGDILSFCSRAVHFIAAKNDRGELRARFKGFKFMIFQTFEDRLGEIVKSFNKHMLWLDNTARNYVQVRIAEIRTMAHEHNAGLERVVDRLNLQDDHLQKMNEYLRRMNDKLEQDKQDKAQEHRMKAVQQTLDALSSLDFSKFYDEIRHKHVEGTGTWLLMHPDYQSWRNSKTSRLLWVKGKPGCGKSFLAARTIKDLDLYMTSSDASAYAFCRRKDRDIHSRVAVLGSLARQIITKQGKLVPTIQDGMRAPDSVHNTDEKSIKKALREAIKRATAAYIVIDGLDECSGENGINLAQDLAEMIQDQNLSPLKIIVFSRPDATFGECFGPVREIRPDHDKINEDDLKTYFDSEFDNQYGKIVITDNQRERCLIKAQGMFQWIYLFRKSLQKVAGRQLRLKNIDNMPDGLAALYDDMLSDIDAYLRPTAWLIFLWITHGKRSLTGIEMREAVAYMTGANRLSELVREQTDDCLVDICANLIFIDRDGCVRFIHDSVRTHLESSPQLQATSKLRSFQWHSEYQEVLSKAHERLSEISLQYLLLRDFEQGAIKSQSQLKLKQKKAPFLQYAASTLGWHVSQATNTAALAEKIEKLMGSVSRRELCMQVCYMVNLDLGFLPLNGSTHPLHLLALVGLKDLTMKLIPNITELLQQPTFDSFTPLHLSVISKHHAMSFWLFKMICERKEFCLDVGELSFIMYRSALYGWQDILERLLELNRPELLNMGIGTASVPPLLVACFAGHLDVTRILLDHGANCNIEDTEGRTALLLATVSENLPMLNLLLQYGANPNMALLHGKTPLYYAAGVGNAAIVESLLTADADPLIETKGDSGRTPLHAAAENDSAEVIEKIVARHQGIDINKRDEDGFSALHVAAVSGATHTAAALIRMKCDIDIGDHEAQTPLYLAVNYEQTDTVKLLIDNGADVTSRTKKLRMTAIHAAAKSGRPGLLQYILKGQNHSLWTELLNASDTKGQTSVHYSIYGGDLETLLFVIDAKADLNKKAILGASPLHYAAYFGRKNMIKPLIYKTKHPNSRDDNGHTPLHYAALRGRTEFVYEMLDFCTRENFCLEIDAKDKFDATPLHAALLSEHFQVAELLHKHNAASIGNKNGFYPIHLACRAGSYHLVKMFIDNEGILKKDGNGQTPLHHAAFSGLIPILQLVAAKCITLLNEPDNDGNSAMMLALKRNQIEATRYLLDLNSDPSVIDTFGNSILHIAASHGELDLVKELVLARFDLTLRNKHGETALMCAAKNNKQEVFHQLMQANPEAVFIPDFTEYGCQHAVARSPDGLKLLKILQKHGLALDVPDLSGCTPMHYAAEGGSLPVIKYLHSQNCASNQGDCNGDTPLMRAIYGGIGAGALFLIRKSTKSNLNQPLTLSGDRIFTFVAARGYLELIEPLLRVGADPYQRDGTGLNAFDYAAEVPAILQILNEKKGADLSHMTATIAMQTSMHTVLRCCDLMMNLASKPLETFETFKYLNILSLLARCLHRLQEFELYALCVRARCWQSDFAFYQENFSCCHCAQTNFEADINFCKSCQIEYFLCTECYQEYESEGKSYPTALIELNGLEGEIRIVRKILPKSFDAWDVFNSVNLFGRGLWIESISKKYDLWEQQHNVRDRYACIEKPGQEFLRIIDSCQQLYDMFTGDLALVQDPTFADSMKKLLARYRRLNQQHPPSKLQSKRRCSGHDFIVVKKEELDAKHRDQNSFLHKDTGRLTNRFLDTLQDMYSHVQQPVSTSHSMAVSTQANHQIADTVNQIATVTNLEASTRTLEQTGFRPMLENKTNSVQYDYPEEMQADIDTKANALPTAPSDPLMSSAQDDIGRLTDTGVAARNDVESEVLEASGASPRDVQSTRLHSLARSHLDELVSDEEQSDPKETTWPLRKRIVDDVSLFIEQSTASWDTDDLRRIYLQLHQHSNDDKEIMIWAVALKIYSTLDFEFLSDYVEGRLEIMAEQDE